MKISYVGCGPKAKKWMSLVRIGLKPSFGSEEDDAMACGGGGRGDGSLEGGYCLLVKVEGRDMLLGGAFRFFEALSTVGGVSSI